MNKSLKYLLLALVAAAAVIAVVKYSNNGGEPSPSASPTASGSPRACTMEAKICPDGSSVGRSGPNCEFAPCPIMKSTPPTPVRY